MARCTPILEYQQYVERRAAERRRYVDCRQLRVRGSARSIERGQAGWTCDACPELARAYVERTLSGACVDGGRVTPLADAVVGDKGVCSATRELGRPRAVTVDAAH